MFSMHITLQFSLCFWYIVYFNEVTKVLRVEHFLYVERKSGYQVRAARMDKDEKQGLMHLYSKNRPMWYVPIRADIIQQLLRFIKDKSYMQNLTCYDSCWRLLKFGKC